VPVGATVISLLLLFVFGLLVLPFYRSSWIYSDSQLRSAESVDNCHPPLLILSTHHPVVAVCGLFAHHAEAGVMRSSSPTLLSASVCVFTQPITRLWSVYCSGVVVVRL